MAYPSKPMTQNQTDAFLSEVRNAVLATNRRDGAPQLSTVWYAYEQGQVFIGFDASSAKCLNIRRDPRVSFCVGGLHPDSRTVTIYGFAEFIEENDPRFEGINTRIHVRYSQSNEEAYADVERALIAIHPEKILAMDFN